MLSRRLFLANAAAGGLLVAAAPRIAFARAETQRRLVVILQRGAADGLATVIPVGDPHFAAQRRDFAADADAALPLDGYFRLNPALAGVKRLYDARQALFVHAVASSYRRRSHFDGQNVLETGGGEPYRIDDGWLNRLLGMLPGADTDAIAVAPTVPVILRGSEPVSNYAPSALPDANADLLERVGMMYAEDEMLHALWDQAVETEALAGEIASRRRIDVAEMGTLAARLMAGPEGARLAVIETGGWDTHTSQRNRLGVALRGLDAGIAALREGLGGAWDETLVIVATEFGRTVVPNGTRGTDHGTASAAMLLGGAVAGGRVIADWPGIAPAQLHEGRDLRPTLSLEGLIAGAAAAHYALDPQRTRRTLFPDSQARPVEGLIRS